jgi:KDO2-lipid IV(A) lauroyltransferase
MNFRLQTLKTVNWLISRLPFSILYLKSDFLAFLLHSVLKYRRKVVEENLRNSFPEKTEAELKQICWQFYHNLSDLIFEILKTQGMTARELQSRMKVVNPELLEKYRQQGSSVIMVSGHCGNWEWYPPATALQCPGFIHNCAIVKPLSSEVFEEFMTFLRTQFMKDVLIPFKSAYRIMASRRHELSLTAILADQTPHKDEINYHTLFLNQQTAVFLGTERIAKSLDHVVIFAHICRVKRGFYEVKFELITESPKLTAEHEITIRHVKILENDIINHPEQWLWSHRRWKYKMED